MDEITYSVKPTAFSAEFVYRLCDDGLVWTGGGQEGRIAFSDIVRVRLFGSPGASCRGTAWMPAFTNCVVQTRGGGKRTISSLYYRGLGQIESRGASFSRWIDALLPRVAEANPNAVFLTGMPTGLWCLWIGVLLINLSLVLLGVAIVVNGATRRDWGDLVIGLIMVLLLGFSVWRLFPVIANGRARQFRPGQATE